MLASELPPEILHNDEGHLCCSPAHHQLEHAYAEQRRREKAGIVDPDDEDLAALKFGLLSLVGVAAFALYEAWRDRRR